MLVTWSTKLHNETISQSVASEQFSGVIQYSNKNTG